MTKLIFFYVGVLSISLFTGNNGKLVPGDKATLTDLKLTDISGNKFSLEDLKLENGILVLFSSNACPFVLQWEGRYNEIKEWAQKNKTGMVVLNSNHSNRNGIDSYISMQNHAKEKEYSFYYLLDEESKLANAFGAQTTPHAFLFNKDFELVYKGAIDDNYKNRNEVKAHFIKDAIIQNAKGQQISVAETKPVGCSIKRKLE